jgi:hypothetical protein
LIQTGFILGRSCEEGWAAFNNSCYLILNNNDQQYDNIDICK